MMRVALVHDWLVAMRGGEKCLESFCDLFPDADVYTLIYDAARVSPAIRRMKVHCSPFNHLYGVEKYYRYGLPIFPKLIERFDLAGYDLILSSSHCVAKGIFPHRNLHIAYIHTPMRYVWDMHDAYFGPQSALTHKVGMSFFRRYLRDWDVGSSERVDHFIANSHNIAGKIRKAYGRDATVIYPPVALENFCIHPHPEDFYLIVSALVPYKKIDIAIAAFNDLKLPLVIAGDGPLRKTLERAAAKHIRFLGWVDDGRLAELYRSCQALIFPGEEDFGIVPLECQASGRPVIGYGKGGLLETVIPLDDGEGVIEREFGPSAILFRQQTCDSLVMAVKFFEQNRDVFDPVTIRAHASGFSRERFKAQIKQFIDARLGEWRAQT